jgi:hypothetical protein
MIGFILFILLLPLIVYWGCLMFSEETSPIRIFMEHWVKSSIYYSGILVGCIGKCALPSTEDKKEELKDLKLSDSFTKGIKSIWK